MKRFKIASLPLLCAAVAPLCADSGMMKSGNNNNSEQQRQQMYKQEMNKITPTAEPSVSRWADPYMTADFIWWKAEEDGLEYAFNGVGDGITNADSGSLKHPRFRYEPGFKVGGGLKFRHDGWDVFAQYTYLRTNTNHHRNSISSDADGDNNVQSNFFIPVAGDLETFQCASASGSWSLHFNVLDGELGRNFWISKWLTLRPFIGMKFSWNDQKLNVNYLGTNFPTDTDNYYLSMKLDQWAVGLRSGMNTAFYMCNKWAIFGEFAVSGLWNDFDASRKDTFQTPLTAVVLNNVKKNNSRLTAVIEWALGFRFETAFHNDDYMFQAQVGWEQQLWFDQNQFVLFPNSSASNLTFQGLTVKAGFWF